MDLNILYHNEKRLSHLPASLMLTYIPVNGNRERNNYKQVEDVDLSVSIDDRIDTVPDLNKIKEIRPLDDILKSFYVTIEKNRSSEISDGWSENGLDNFTNKKLNIRKDKLRAYYDQM